MEFTGTITDVYELRSGTSSHGNAWESQDYRIEDRGQQYSQSLVFNVFGHDRIGGFNIRKGDALTASLSFETHDYNGRTFTKIKCYRVTHNPETTFEPQQQQPQQSVPDALKNAQPYEAPKKQPSGSTEDSELPF